MIVVPEGDGEWTLVTQGDHARFAAQLLALWQSPPIAELPHAQELLFAVREHDNGWRELDAAPLLHPEGDRPHDFLTLPEADRKALWERGTARYEAEHPLAALLITEHALALLGNSDDAHDPRSTAALVQRREELLERTQCCETELADLYHRLALADWLSLVACNQGPPPFANRPSEGRFSERQGVHAAWSDGSLLLDPFPLAGATTFDLPIRRIRRQQWTGDSDLGLAVMTAVWQETSLRVAAAP